jgi:hypothetical protein
VRDIAFLDRVAAGLVSGLVETNRDGLALPPGARRAVRCVNAEGHIVSVISRGESLELYATTGDGAEASCAALDLRTAVRIAWWVLVRWWGLGLWCGLKPHLFAWAARRLQTREERQRRAAPETA